MAKENVAKFYELLKENEELQSKINANDQAYAGDKDNQKAAVEAIILPVAKEAGLEFSAEELMTYESSQAGNAELDDEELENIAGGWGFCIGIGFSTKPEAKLRGRKEARACAFIGIGGGGSWD